jgi:hypothetical protein
VQLHFGTKTVIQSVRLKEFSSGIFGLTHRSLKFVQYMLSFSGFIIYLLVPYNDIVTQTK